MRLTNLWEEGKSQHGRAPLTLLRRGRCCRPHPHQQVLRTRPGTVSPRHYVWTRGGGHSSARALSCGSAWGRYLTVPHTCLHSRRLHAGQCVSQDRAREEESHATPHSEKTPRGLCVAIHKPQPSSVASNRTGQQQPLPPDVHLSKLALQEPHTYPAIVPARSMISSAGNKAALLPTPFFLICLMYECHVCMYACRPAEGTGSHYR